MRVRIYAQERIDQETIDAIRSWIGKLLNVSPLSAWASMCLAVVIRCVTRQPSPSPETLVLCLPPFFLIRDPIFALQCRVKSEFEQCLVHSGVGHKAA